MASNIEVIGAGCLADGVSTSGKSDFPVPIRPNAPIGQHLRVERLVRVLPDRMLYLANNHSPLWSHRKCWACGHLYSPNRAQSCTLCGTPLRDRRFLVSVHLDADKFTGFEGFHQNDMGQLRIIQPILMTYRERRLVAVYPYNGERLLVDEPAALRSDYLLILVHRLAGLLNSFHERGAVLSEFTAANIVKLPDGSPAWFDVDIARVVGSRAELLKMQSKPIARDLANLCRIASRYCNASNEGLKKFFEKGAVGDRYHEPNELLDELEAVLDKYSDFADTDRVAMYTDSGLVRALNEDTWSCTALADGVMLYVCADGMGGHAGGEWASAEACDSISNYMAKKVQTSELEPLRVHLEDAIRAANGAIVAEGKRRGAAIGTTVVAAMVSFRKLLIAHVGDSRGYLLRDGKLMAITKDHSLVALWVERGKLSREEARVHPKSNVLHSHLGQEDDLDVDLSVFDLKSGDRVLICSDGLWGEIPETEIGHIVCRFPKPKDCVQHLVRAAYAAGGSDNTTVMVVDIP